jgi:hypothetical protein
MSNSVRLACAFGAIVVATFALGPATAGSGTLRLADADSRAVICKPALDGSRTCTYETGVALAATWARARPTKPAGEAVASGPAGCLSYGRAAISQNAFPAVIATDSMCTVEQLAA